MREISPRTDGSDSRAPDAAPRSEPDAASSREKLEDTLGGALSRVLARAGIGVRVVPAGAADPAGASPPPAAAPAPACPIAAGPADAAAVLPARDELVTLLTLVVGGQLLGKLPAGALIESVPTSAPAAASGPVKSATQQAAGAAPTARPWQAAPSPPVTGPLPPKPAPARPPGAAPAPAASHSTGKPAPGPTKGRGFTIRY